MGTKPRYPSGKEGGAKRKPWDRTKATKAPPEPAVKPKTVPAPTPKTPKFGAIRST